MFDIVGQKCERFAICVCVRSGGAPHTADDATSTPGRHGRQTLDPLRLPRHLARAPTSPRSALTSPYKLSKWTYKLTKSTYKLAKST